MSDLQSLKLPTSHAFGSTNFVKPLLENSENHSFRNCLNAHQHRDIKQQQLMLIDRNKKTFKNKLKRIQKVEYM